MADLVIDVVIDAAGVSVEVPVVHPPVQVSSNDPVGVVVVAGPPGVDGAPGPLNSGFTHTQTTPAATWTITHTLGRPPLNCEVIVDNEIVYTDVSYPDALTVVVTFASPQSGTARLT